MKKVQTTSMDQTKEGSQFHLSLKNYHDAKVARYFGVKMLLH